MGREFSCNCRSMLLLLLCASSALAQVWSPQSPFKARVTSPYDYELDDITSPRQTVTPDTWSDRVSKVKDLHKNTFNYVVNGLIPPHGWMGTGLRRPINPLMEAQELSDIDPFRVLSTIPYAYFRSMARNPEMRGPTLRRLEKSEVMGFDHTNGQYGLPLGTGLRGIGSASMGLTKIDYGPFGLGPLHPNPIQHAMGTAAQSVSNQIAAPFGAAALLGWPRPSVGFV
eukprot:c45345_g1_i1.p1 GENE.c45345_g1_i1~~c45345_g1_i1.p1  ORF type:complete len:227 (-),score=17.16 c45345_g1_i1:60-740(-)